MLLVAALRFTVHVDQLHVGRQHDLHAGRLVGRVQQIVDERVAVQADRFRPLLFVVHLVAVGTAAAAMHLVLVRAEHRVAVRDGHRLAVGAGRRVAVADGRPAVVHQLAGRRWTRPVVRGSVRRVVAGRGRLVVLVQRNRFGLRKNTTLYG